MEAEIPYAMVLAARNLTLFHRHNKLVIQVVPGMFLSQRPNFDMQCFQETFLSLYSCDWSIGGYKGLATPIVHWNRAVLGPIERMQGVSTSNSTSR